MSFISRCSGLFALLTICFISTIAQDPEVQRAVKTCSQQLKISPDQIVAALTELPPKNHGDKYILHCIVDALGMMSPHGKLKAQKSPVFTDRKKAVMPDKASKTVDSGVTQPHIPWHRVTEIRQYPQLPKSSYYDDSEDEGESGYFELDVLSESPRKTALHSKTPTKNRVRRQSGSPVPQPPANFPQPPANFPQPPANFPQPPANFQNPNPNQQNYPIPSQQNYPIPSQQNYPNPNNPNQQYPNNQNPVLSPALERALSTVRDILSDPNNPNGPYNQNGQPPYYQNAPYNPSQQPYNQNAPYNPSQQPYNQNAPLLPYTQPTSQRSKRSPQDVILTSQTSELIIPAEVTAEISQRLREFFAALISSQESRDSNSTDSNVQAEAEIIEPTNRPPRKRRDEGSSTNQKPPADQQIPVLSVLRERANSGVFHQFRKYLQDASESVSVPFGRTMNRTQTQPSLPPMAQIQPSLPPMAQTQPSLPPMAQTQPSLPPMAQTQPSLPPMAQTQPSLPPMAHIQPSLPPKA